MDVPPSETVEGLANALDAAFEQENTLRLFKIFNDAYKPQEQNATTEEGNDDVANGLVLLMHPSTPHPMSIITPQQLEMLLPRACAWAVGQERAIVQSGAALGESQLADARRVGVAQPERLRLLRLAQIPVLCGQPSDFVSDIPARESDLRSDDSSSPSQQERATLQTSQRISSRELR